MKIQTSARRYYAPLDISVSAYCTTPDCPLTQTYDGKGYIPDRENGSEYTAVAPLITACASDGTWNGAISNSKLAQFTWQVFYNGAFTDIAKVSEWSDKYSIDTSDSDSRGELEIRRNLPSNAVTQLRFVGKLLDSRTDTTVDIVTQPLTISTVDKGADTYGVSINDADNIVYNPTMDMLDLYDYKVANGIISDDADVRKSACDGNQYEREVTYSVYQGITPLTTGFSATLCRVENGDETALVAGVSELVSITTEKFVLDLRLIENASYVLRIFLTSAPTSEVARSAFAVSRKHGEPNIVLMNEASMSFYDTRRWQKAIVTVDNVKIEYPQRIFDMEWSTEASNKAGNYTAERTWNKGESTEYAISDTGMGMSENDYISDFLNIEKKAAYAFLIDESGNMLTDNSGNYLIGNY